MKGLKIVSVYLGIAWLLGGTGAVWSNCATGSQEVDSVRTSFDQQIGELRETREQIETKGNAPVATAKEKLAAEETKLEKAGAELKARVATLTADQKAAKEAGDTKKAAKLQKDLTNLNNKLARILKGPTKSRDQAQEALIQAEEALEAQLGQLDEEIAKVKKQSEAATAGVNVIAIEPVFGAVLGLLLIGFGIVAGMLGGPGGGARIGRRPQISFDDGDLDDTPAPGLKPKDPGAG